MLTMTSKPAVDHGEHLSDSAEHYTPSDLVEAARRTMGTIDTDPATCEEAQKTIRARWYYTRENCGLKHPWDGSVLVNAPGSCRDDETGEYPGCGTLFASGKRRTSCSCKLPQRFWAHLVDQVEVGNANEFVWVGFNIAHLRTLQTYGAWLLAQCHLFVPAKRVRFSGASPTKDNAILYWGPHSFRFFSQFGKLDGEFWRGSR